LTSGKGTKGQFDLSVFANVPDDLLEDRELNVRDAERALRDAGFSRHKAKALLAGRSQDTEGAGEVIAALKETLKIKKGGM
jgi:hypothetical protein